MNLFTCEINQHLSFRTRLLAIDCDNNGKIVLFNNSFIETSLSRAIFICKVMVPHDTQTIQVLQQILVSELM